MLGAARFLLGILEGNEGTIMAAVAMELWKEQASIELVLSMLLLLVVKQESECHR